MKKAHKNLTVLKIAILVAVFGVSLTGVSYAYYMDTETTTGNTLGAGSLDAEVTSAETELHLPAVAGDMHAGDSVERTGTILNVGSLAFKYSVAFEKVSGDDAVCDGLQLEAVEDGNNRYTGDLSGFDHTDGELAVGDTDNWTFVVTHPGSLPIDESCDFDLLFTAWQTSMSAPIGGWVDTEEIDNNVIRTGIQTPEQTGYNENNGDSAGVPRDPNELACTGDFTNVNGISVHWTDVAEGDNDVKYQRQYKVGSGGWSGNEIYTDPYTNYRSFGGGVGSENIYGSRVRAWVDADHDNSVNGDEVVSDWSNECYITYDATAPAQVDGMTIYKGRNTSGEDLGCSGVTDDRWITVDWNDSSDVNFKEYRYQTKGTWNTTLVPSQRTGQISDEDGEYKYKVQAIDKAGNTGEYSDWCYVTLDRAAPELTIDSVELIAKSVAHYTTEWKVNENKPTLVGTVDDVTDVTVIITINSIDYDAIVVGTEWKVDVTDELPDGTYEITASATDLAGNETTVTQEIVIDTVAPTADYTYYKNGVAISDITAVTTVQDVSELTFNGTATDTDPSAGLLYDSFVIFEAQDDGSFRFSTDNKKAYCGWRREPNLVHFDGTNSFTIGTPVEFTDCVDTLPDGEYYMTHHVYDEAIRKDIPSIHQFRDVLGVHFVVDAPPAMPIGLERRAKSDGAVYACGDTAPREILYPDWDNNTEADFDHYEYSSFHPGGGQGLDEVVKTTSEFIHSWTPPADGTYGYAVRAVDKAGNKSPWALSAETWDGSCQITYDSTFVAATVSRISGDDTQIVLNEFLPNPIGDDDATMPSGEWVELYNKGAEDVDVAGWYLYDADNEHALEVTVRNADGNGDTNDGGETIVPANGFLVVYRNGDTDFSLNNDADELRLYDGVIADGAFLVDAYTYDGRDYIALPDTPGAPNSDAVSGSAAQSIPEGKSFARFPDGGVVWIDPEITPRDENELSDDELLYFRAYTFVACFDSSDSLDKDASDELCDGEFLEYLGMLDDENDTDLAFTQLLEELHDDSTDDATETESVMTDVSKDEVNEAVQSEASDENTSKDDPKTGDVDEENAEDTDFGDEDTGLAEDAEEQVEVTDNSEDDVAVGEPGEEATTETTEEQEEANTTEPENMGDEETNDENDNGDEEEVKEVAKEEKTTADVEDDESSDEDSAESDDEVIDEAIDESDEEDPPETKSVDSVSSAS